MRSNRGGVAEKVAWLQRRHAAGPERGRLRQGSGGWQREYADKRAEKHGNVHGKPNARVLRGVTRRFGLRD